MTNKHFLTALFRKTQIALNTMGYPHGSSADFIVSFLFWKYLSDTADLYPERKNPGDPFNFNYINRRSDSLDLDQQIEISLGKWSLAMGFEDMLTLEFRNISKQLLSNVMYYWYTAFESHAGFWTSENIEQAFDSLAEFMSEETRDGHRWFTPRSVARLMAEALDISKAESIYDPFSRTGDMLSLLKARIPHGVSAEGFTPDPTVFKIAKIYAFMKRSDVMVKPGSFLHTNPEKKFDLILTNPPFGEELRLEDDYPAGDWAREFTSTKGTVRYITHCLDHLSPLGKMAIIVPTGFLSGAGRLEKLRARIVRENLLEVVVQLPAKIFYGTDVSASVLFLNKIKQFDQVLFINAADRRDRSGDRVILTQEDMGYLKGLISSFSATGKLSIPGDHSAVLTPRQIHENDMSWIPPKPKKVIIRRPLKELLDEGAELKASWKSIYSTLNNLISD